MVGLRLGIVLVAFGAVSAHELTWWRINAINEISYAINEMANGFQHQGDHHKHWHDKMHKNIREAYACHKKCGTDAACHSKCPKPWAPILKACQDFPAIKACHATCNDAECDNCPKFNMEWLNKKFSKHPERVVEKAGVMCAMIEKAIACHMGCSPGDYECHQKCGCWRGCGPTGKDAEQDEPTTDDGYGDSDGDVVHVAILCTEPEQHRSAHMAIQNILSVTRSPVAVHFLSVGTAPLPPIEVSMNWSLKASSVKVYDLAQLPFELASLQAEMASHTEGRGKPLMYKPLLHKILPSELQKVILWDLDVFTLKDVRELWAEFGLFKQGQIIGLAAEQQATYYNWWPEEGNSYFHGYNDGVQLLDLMAMRQSSLFNDIVLSHHYGEWLPDKSIRFSSGGLGDQDFYSVLGHQHPELFHTLPCGWNRQLCEYWNRRLPAIPVERCPWQSVKVLRGNCGGPWSSPCSANLCSEGQSASGLVDQLLRAECGSTNVSSSLANLGLLVPHFNCDRDSDGKGADYGDKDGGEDETEQDRENQVLV